MRVEFLREKLIAGLCCLLGMAACGAMWFEAGLDHPTRPLRIFGGPKSTPFWERQYPESNILFSGCALGMILASLLGLVQCREQIKPPEILHGPAFVLAGFFLGLLLYQARTVNGVTMDVIQPGFFVAMAACTGMVLAGIMIIMRSMWSTG
jgi:hypothetical protein